MAATGTVTALCRRVLGQNHFHLKSLKNGGIPFLIKKHQHQIAEKKALGAALSAPHTHREQSIVYQTNSVQVCERGITCDIEWKDGLCTEFHSIWLRHNCHCSQCRHDNGQKLMTPSNISSEIRIQNLSVKDDHVEIEWNTEIDHKGILPLKFIRDHNYNEETILKQRQAVKTVNPVSIPTVKYEDIKNSTDEYRKWLQQINEEGLSIVQGVPLEDNLVKTVAELIAPVWNSIYGEVFDVESVPNPQNIAYSSHGLCYHMDLIYFQSPPGLQLLHCLKFDDCVEGGISQFLDAFAIAEEFRCNYPDLFHILTTIPASFQKVHYERESPVHLVNQKPHIKLNHKGDIVAVYWAPGFEGALSVSGSDVIKYYKAYEMFAKSMIHSPLSLKHRLQPGELVIFNNLRILHSRTYFDLNGGSRHLQGCYVNIDMFKSKVQVANILHSDGRLVKRVGNECWH